jgi:hypothetical protein
MTLSWVCAQAAALAKFHAFVANAGDGGEVEGLGGGLGGGGRGGVVGGEGGKG